MLPATPRALIYMTGRNCERYVRAAIESVAWQTHGATWLLFVDDCSDDGTAAAARALLQSLLPGRHAFVRNPVPWGKARNAHVHLREALGHGEFVAILDADDQLIRSTILAEMAAEYANGHDVVWTMFETEDGQRGCSRPLDPLRGPREQGWRTSHFFSFRAELFANVGEDYLQDDRGQWFQAACDQAIAMPVLDQTRRYRFLPVSALRYTSSNPNSHHNRDPEAANFSSRLQAANAELVRAKPPLPCTRWALGERAGGDQALFELRETLRAELQALSGRLEILANARTPPAGAVPSLPPSIAGFGAVAAPVPASRPAAIAGAPVDPATPWTQAAAAVLAQRCPALLALMLDGQDGALPVADAWRWWHWLQASGRPPAVLEIGAGPLAAPVRAMVQALGGRFLSASTERERALALWARLEAAGQDADVLHVPAAQVAIEGWQGEVADLSTLPDDATGFDLLLTSAAGPGADPATLVLALPMAIARMAPEGFRVCLWAPAEPALRQTVAAAWTALVPQLDGTDQAFAGQAACLHAG